MQLGGSALDNGAHTICLFSLFISTPSRTLWGTHTLPWRIDCFGFICPQVSPL